MFQYLTSTWRIKKPSIEKHSISDKIVVFWSDYVLNCKVQLPSGIRIKQTFVWAIMMLKKIINQLLLHIFCGMRTFYH